MDCRGGERIRTGGANCGGGKLSLSWRLCAQLVVWYPLSLFRQFLWWEGPLSSPSSWPRARRVPRPLCASSLPWAPCKGAMSRKTRPLISSRGPWTWWWFCHPDGEWTWKCTGGKEYAEVSAQALLCLIVLAQALLCLTVLTQALLWLTVLTQALLWLTVLTQALLCLTVLTQALLCLTVLT